MINLALIGGAHIHTPGFIKRIQNRDNFRVTAVWDHNADTAQRRAEALGASVVDDPDAVWSDDAIAAVVICSETDRHEPLVRAAAAAGKHMFVEKPLGLAAADAYAMADAIDAAGVLFQTGYFQRGDPKNLFVKEAIKRGHFGKITRLRHSNCHSGSLRGLFDTEWAWMADLEQAGVGGFGDLGTHSLDIMLWLLGDVERVAATVHVATGRYGECDEYGEGLLNFANGAVGSLAAGWVDVSHPVNLIVSGTEGHAHTHGGQLYFSSNRVDGADGEQPWTDLPEAWPHAFELFLDAVTGKPNVPLVGAREAAVRSDVMGALYRAAEEETWVAPEYAS